MGADISYNIDNTFKILSNTETDVLIDQTLNYIGMDEYDVKNIVFSPEDVTLGSETELQVVVKGKSSNVDLPLKISGSDYCRDLVKRTVRNDISPKILNKLNDYLHNNKTEIWENSWVYFKEEKVNTFGRQLFYSDLKSDKASDEDNFRSDIAEFVFEKDGVRFFRMPVSYLIKVAAADLIAELVSRDSVLFPEFCKILDNFLSDNTSPETTSFHVCRKERYETPGQSLAAETSIRFLFTNLSVKYANIKFGLLDEGQEADVYFSPHVPVRQKFLNKCIPDSFYRELFMNPCLSGWNEGEKKKDYMSLCHMTLSRSSLHTLNKLKEAGMIFNNLVELPDVSNVSLGNNGVHVSIGSSKMTEACILNEEFSERHEKAFGDLIIKITEHFIPLFPGLYSSAPLRMSFKDFRMEKALGFLPHELDYYHLRILWRRWKRKSKNKLFGKIITPLGFNEIDSFFEKLLGFKGDFVLDHRLIDYPGALLSSDLSSPIDGDLESEIKYKSYLHSCGVFDKNMSIYLLNKLRKLSSNGFCGMESRFYSLFENFSEDMENAVNLQILLQMLAVKYVSKFGVRHRDISSDPFTESERRNVFFSSAINLPVLNFKIDSDSIIQKRIISNCDKVKKSKRYKGFYKINQKEYMSALVKTIEKDASDIITEYGFESLMEDLKQRVSKPYKYSSFIKITRGVLSENKKKKISSEYFNEQIEKYYRTTLKNKHLDEGINYLKKSISNKTEQAFLYESMNCLADDAERRNVSDQINEAWNKILNDEEDLSSIKKIMSSILVSEFLEK